MCLPLNLDLLEIVYIRRGMYLFPRLTTVLCSVHHIIIQKLVTEFTFSYHNLTEVSNYFTC